MFDFLQRFVRREPELKRGPGSERPKTYSADSGYVYEYSFAGFRRSGGSIEYVFSVTGGRTAAVRVRVVLPEAEVREWTGRDRDLTASERYGIAKVCLKHALDRAPNPQSVAREVAPAREEIAEVADLLDL